MKFLSDFVSSLVRNTIKIISLTSNRGRGKGQPSTSFSRRPLWLDQRKSEELTDNRQADEINRDAMHFFKFSLANFLCRANFDSGMNLSVAAKRMTTSTSSIISTTTKSITANGEARN
jgi:hypothetical protein